MSWTFLSKRKIPSTFLCFLPWGHSTGDLLHFFAFSELGICYSSSSGRPTSSGSWLIWLIMYITVGIGLEYAASQYAKIKEERESPLPGHFSLGPLMVTKR